MDMWYEVPSLLASILSSLPLCSILPSFILLSSFPPLLMIPSINIVIMVELLLLMQYTWTHDRMWRKNRRPTIHPHCVGVDINRNFPTGWILVT